MACWVSTSRLACAALVVAACSGPPGPNADAGVTDAGEPAADAAAADAASPDAGPCAALANGSDCDDGDACTQVDVCLDGACVGTTPIVCEAQQTCRIAGTCDPADGDCSVLQAPDGTECDDHSVCTRTDTCLDGRCIGGDVMPFPGDPCDDGICFTDVTVAAGIAWAAAPSGTKLIGAGAAWLDADGDGWLDLLLVSEGGAPALFRNAADGTFTDVTASSGLAPSATKRLMSAAAADYDNDGDADLFLYYFGENELYANNGAGVFTDVTDTAGVAGGEEWTTAAAFGDYDGDGWLDLYVGNYILMEMFPFHAPFPNALYHNNGDGTFSDVTAATGTAGAGTTLALAWSDYDADGDADLFVCNDFGSTVEPNQLYANNGDGSFAEVAAAAGAALEVYCMGVAPGDYDRDGDLDYYFTNLGRNVLLAAAGGGFSDATASAGVELTYDACFTDLFVTSWAAAFRDFDSDGWLDLYVSNGHIPAAVEIENPESIMNSLFRNAGDGTFTDASHTAEIDDDAIGRGAAFADYDQDGDIDLVQVNLDGAILFRNDSPAPGGSIQLTPRGRASNRDGLGLRVTDGTFVTEVASQYGFEGTSERTTHIGTGAAAEADLSFAWPSGVAHQWLHVPAGTRAELVEPRVTIEGTSLLTDPVAEGETAQLQLTLRNHTGAPQMVDATATLRVPGEAPAVGSPSATTVPPGATATVTVGVAVPSGITGGSATTAELSASVSDAEAARDDAATTPTVTP